MDRRSGRLARGAHVVIVVDTSVWIDYFRGAETWQDKRLEQLIASGATIAITGIIRTELLQGVSSSAADQLKRHLDAILLLDLVDEDYDSAATLYRMARDAGSSVRTTLDCLIAAPCIRTGSPLLHNDADFQRIAQVGALALVTDD